MRPISLLIFLSLFAAGAVPQTQPASALSDPPADTPRQALHSVNIAQRDGDAHALKLLFLAKNERESKLLDAMADYAAALAGLHVAAEQAYGAEGAIILVGDVKAESEKGLSAIEKSEVTVDENAASVKYAGAIDAPIQLEKSDGRWKVLVSQLLAGTDEKAADKAVKELAEQSHIARTMATEIQAGKFKEGANKAREVWRSRLLEGPKGKKG